MPDDDADLSELRRLATLAGFAPFATSTTPWPTPREGAIRSLNRLVVSRTRLLDESARCADPAGYLTGSHIKIADLVVAVSSWAGAWQLVGEALDGADDVAAKGIGRDETEAALTRLDTASAAVRHVGKVYLASWGDFGSEPLPHAVAPLTNVALYSHRWFRELVRRRNAEESLNLTMSSLARYRWGVQNLAGSVVDTTLPGVTDWFREVASLLDAVAGVMVEATIAASTTVRYHE